MKDVNIFERDLKGVFVVVGGHTYARSTDNFVYLSKLNTTGKLEIYKVDPDESKLDDSISLVKTPSMEQFENALLNLIIEDEHQNPSKRGLYSLGFGKIYYEYLDSLSNIKYGKDDGHRLVHSFALNKDDKVVKNLVRAVVACHTQENEKTMTK